MTHEYLRAVATYDFLGYKDLKRMARMSLERGLLAGSSRWASAFHPLAACANNRVVAGKVSSACQGFLDASEPAQMQ
jgi:hypothetical protein